MFIRFFSFSKKDKNHVVPVPHVYLGDTPPKSKFDDFKDKVDNYVNDCKENLAVVNKVYKSFADAMTPSSSQETVLRIGR